MELRVIKFKMLIAKLRMTAEYRCQKTWLMRIGVQFAKLIEGIGVVIKFTGITEIVKEIFQWQDDQ